MPQIGEKRYIDQHGKDRRIWHACIDCGKERWVRPVGGAPKNLRCFPCASRLFPRRFGDKTGGWKGGRVKTNQGYIQIKVYPDNFFYPMANKAGYIPEHRLIVAKALGRCLLSWEIVHHKNEVRDDNRYPENLQLLPSGIKHNILTRMAKYIARLEKEIEGLKATRKVCYKCQTMVYLKEDKLKEAV